jgi:hypothetical protein
MIENASDLVTALEATRWFREPHAHIRYWFRGQPVGLPLWPQVYRGDFGGAGMSEEERFDKECRLIRNSG